MFAKLIYIKVITTIPVIQTSESHLRQMNIFRPVVGLFPEVQIQNKDLSEPSGRRTKGLTNAFHVCLRSIHLQCGGCRI